MQKNIARAFQSRPIEIFGNEIRQKTCIFWHKNNFFSKICHIYPPSVIHHWKGMAMRDNNLFNLNFYGEPIIAQNFDDITGK